MQWAQRSSGIWPAQVSTSSQFSSKFQKIHELSLGLKRRFETETNPLALRPVMPTFPLQKCEDLRPAKAHASTRMMNDAISVKIQLQY